MDDSSLDEGPSVDFGRATLQIAKENEATHHNQVLPSTTDNGKQFMINSIIASNFKLLLFNFVSRNTKICLMSLSNHY